MSKGYKVFVPATQKVIVSKSVKIDESSSWNQESMSVQSCKQPKNVEEVIQHQAEELEITSDDEDYGVRDTHWKTFTIGTIWLCSNL